MFAYCGNNPVLRLDPAGYSWWGDFWEWVKDSTEEKKEKASDNGNGTGTIGITTSAAFGIGGSVSLGITFDEKGNIGIAGTFNAGGGFPSAGIGGFVTVTNAPNIYKQNGLGTVVGASGGPGVIAVGGEFSIMADTENCETYYGGTISATAGLYPTFIEIHGEVGCTSVVGFNVFDAVMAIANAMLWIEEGIRP
jgi:hypothetical protein